MSDINLLQNQLEADNNRKFKKILSLIETTTVGLLAVALILTAGLFVWNGNAKKSQTEAAKNVEVKKVKLEATVASQRDRVVKTQMQIENASEILANHPQWTHFLKMINSASVTGVQFLELSGSVKGELIITALAPDFTTIAAFNKKLNELEGVKQVVLNSSTLAETGSRAFYQYTFSVTFDPDILKLESK